VNIAINRRSVLKGAAGFLALPQLSFHASAQALGDLITATPEKRLEYVQLES